MSYHKFFIYYTSVVAKDVVKISVVGVGDGLPVSIVSKSLFYYILKLNSLYPKL